MNEHILGLDIGDVRIGIALSDASRIIASPLEVYTRVGWGPDCRYIASLCAEYDTSEVVSGLPRNMDGTEGFQAEKVKQFCSQLEKCGLTVYYQDERLTTVTAENALREGGVFRQDRRRQVDRVAAAVILQAWLDTRRNQAETQAQHKEIWRRQPDMNGSFEENDDILTLLDENGEPVEFEHLATVEYEGEFYLCLAEAGEEEQDAETEVIIMKVTEDENGEECYEAVEDEAVLDAVFERFLEIIDEDEESEEDED